MSQLTWFSQQVKERNLKLLYLMSNTETLHSHTPSHTSHPHSLTLTHPHSLTPSHPHSHGGSRLNVTNWGERGRGGRREGVTLL